MKMKRIISILLVVVMTVGLASCAGSSTPKSGKKTSKKSGEIPKGYSTTTITTTKNGEVLTEREPYSVSKTRTSTVEKDSEKLAYLTVDNINAVMHSWQGFDAVHQGWLFVPDSTDLGRTYTPKMIERELGRIDDMDITFLRSYYEASYAFTGDFNDAGEPIYDWNSQSMQYFYQWVEALQKRGVQVVLNMGWSVNDAAVNKTTSFDGMNPFYGMHYSKLLKCYGIWIAESIHQLVEVRGYTNVRYAMLATEPLYNAYSGTRLVELPVLADGYGDRYMAVLDDETICTTNVKTMYSSNTEYLNDDDRNKGIRNPDYVNRREDAKFYDINTGAEIPGVKGRLYTPWDFLVQYMRTADATMKQYGNRNLIQIVGPNYAIPNNYLDIGTSYLDAIQWWIDKANDYIDIYSYHYYVPAWPYVPGSYAVGSFFDDNYDMNAHFFNEITAYIKERTGKTWWFDESNYHPSTVDGNKVGSLRQDYAELFATNPLNGGQINQTVIAAMNTGVSSYIFWQLFETVWPHRSGDGDEFLGGIHVMGSAPAICESSLPYVLYYDIGLLAKYGGMANSTTYCGTGKDGVCLTMVQYEKDGKQYQSVIVQNMNVQETKIDVQFAKSLNGVNLYRYVYNPYEVEPDSSATLAKADVCLKGVANRFQDSVPAMSLAIYSTEYNP